MDAEEYFREERAWKRRCAWVIHCGDGRLRAFTDTGLCIGVVIDEKDIATDPESDPIGPARGIMAGVCVSAMILAVVYLAVRFGMWLGSQQ